MNAAFHQLSGLRVSVDRVIHLREAETPQERPYCFIYFITIHNESDSSVTIKGRKWVVRNERGEVTAVEGAGVVGKMPEIPPGGHFSYNSFHLLDTPTGMAEGSYIGTDGEGRSVITRIPQFRLEADAGAKMT